MPVEFPDLELQETNPISAVPVGREWWYDWPDTVERAVEILASRAVHLQELTEEGIQLRNLLEWCEKQHTATEDLLREEYPIAYFKPGYEQSLMLNCWWCGYDFPICFSANRIGKTAVFVVNGMMWIIPNNPEWRMFLPYQVGDENDLDKDGNRENQTNPNAGRWVHVLQRPDIRSIAKLQEILAENPQLVGDPYQPYNDEPSGNKRKFATLQMLCPQAFRPAFPAAPQQEGGTIWLGAPDNAYHREIVLPEWKRWLPKSYIFDWSESDNKLGFQVRTMESGNPRPTCIQFHCKSYESKDTKWSGIAVLGIILTEGLEPAVLDEVKQRIKAHGFASWDYTPYEAANVGKKTALAQKVYEGKEELPLKTFCFVGFEVENAPSHIIPETKKQDMIRTWAGKSQGRARLKGLFFSTSPKILSKIDRPFHCLPWSKDELFAKFPNIHKFRSIDPGYDHPTACCWSGLNSQNISFIFRFYSESGRTIGERSKDIIRLSNNGRYKRYWGKRATEFIWQECHPRPDSEVYTATIADYHTFKADETTGQSLALRYQNEGLPIIPSVTVPPRDRAQKIDDHLDRQEFYKHPIFGTTPGARLYFLINEPGVEEALTKMEELYWERYKTGDRKGLPKDEVPKDDDDELDALGQIVCAPFTWHPHLPRREEPPDVENIMDIDEADSLFATLQSPNSIKDHSPEVSNGSGFGGGYVDYFVQ